MLKSWQKKPLIGGLLALGLAAAPPAPPAVRPAAAVTPAVRPASAVATDPVAAKDPLGTLIADGQTGYARLRDYACTFTRQERVNGLLGAEQVAEMKVRVQPFSVYLRFARPESVAGQEAAYVERGRPDGKMKFRPAGVEGISGFQIRALDDPKVLATSRRPVSKLGMGAILDTLSTVVNRERALNNPIEVYLTDYEFAGRPVTRYEVFTRRPHIHRSFYRAVVCVDKETKLPVRYEAYDQPRAGGATTGELMEVFSYSDIRPNVGLGDSVFSK